MRETGGKAPPSSRDAEFCPPSHLHLQQPLEEDEKRAGWRAGCPRQVEKGTRGPGAAHCHPRLAITQTLIPPAPSAGQPQPPPWGEGVGMSFFERQICLDAHPLVHSLNSTRVKLGQANTRTPSWSPTGQNGPNNTWAIFCNLPGSFVGNQGRNQS